MKKGKNSKIHTAGHRSRGAALTIAVLFFIVISLAVVLGSLGPVVRDLATGRELLQSKLTYATTEAGIEEGFYRAKTNKQISSPEMLSLNGGTASITVSDIGTSEKEIISNGTYNTLRRNARMTLNTSVGSDFAYGAQVGEGGLEMENNSRVEGYNNTPGNVYSNGPIDGSQGTVITGSATVATTISPDLSARSLVCNQDQIVGQNTPQIDFAQSFVPSDSKPLYKVSLYVKKVGASNPPTATVRIVADNAGSPGTSSLASATLQASLVTGSYSWVDVTFSSPASVALGQTYWIVLDASQDANRYWVWCGDSAQGYAAGAAKYKQSWNGSGGWTAITPDLAFQTYLGAGPGKIEDTHVYIDAHANTIEDSTIEGVAYCQTGSGNNVACNTSQPDPGPLNMPISQGNIDQWKSDAADGGVINGNCGNSGDSSCTVPDGGTLYIGPKKINGNLTLTNNRTIVLTGVVYVTGTVSISNNATVRCDISFGDDSCVFLADGSIDISNNGVIQGSGTYTSYMLLISTIAGCNGSGGTGCASGSSGINIGNNVTGGIFFTTSSMILISNNATIKAVVGYKLKLSNNAVIRYEPEVGVTNFASGPGGGWNVKTWKEVQ